MDIPHGSHRSGQSLLVIVLLISVVFTLIATASYRLSTETQSTKSQEENIRTLAAADSGIERGLDYLNNTGVPDAPQTFSSLGLNLTGIDANRSTVSIANTGGRSFSSPVIFRDQQYVYYLSRYNPANSTFGSHYTGSSLNVYFASGTAGNCNATRPPAIEVTIVYGLAGDRVEKQVVEPCNVGNRIVGTGRTTPSYIAAGVTINGTRYFYRFSYTNIASSYPQPRLLILRPLFADTSLGVTTNVDMPDQGTTITAEAFATSGASKVVTLFQPYPQIPADFFVTTF